MRKWIPRLVARLRLTQNTPKTGQKRPCEPRTEIERGNVAWPLLEFPRSVTCKYDTQHPEDRDAAE